MFNGLNIGPAMKRCTFFLLFEFPVPFYGCAALPSEERVRKGTLVPIFVVNSASKCVKPPRLTNVNKRQRERYKWRMYHIIEVWATR